MKEKGDTVSTMPFHHKSRQIRLPGQKTVDGECHV